MLAHATVDVFNDAPPGVQGFTFNVNNSGSQTASNVKVGNTVPSTWQITGCAASGGGTCSANGSNNNTVTFPTLAPGQSALVTLLAMNAGRNSGGQALLTSNVVSDSGNSDQITSSFTANIPIPNIQIDTPVANATITGPVNVTGFALRTICVWPRPIATRRPIPPPSAPAWPSATGS